MNDSTADGWPNEPTLITCGPATGWTIHPDGRFTHPSGRTIRTRGPGFNCCDCGVNTVDIGEHFMVLDHLWETAVAAAPVLVPNSEGCEMLCIGCLETRIGRRLAPDDFTPGVLLNDPRAGGRSDRLLDRMTATAVPA